MDSLSWSPYVRISLAREVEKDGKEKEVEIPMVVIGQGAL